MMTTSCSKEEQAAVKVDVDYCATLDCSPTRGDAYVPNANKCVMEIYYEGALYERQVKDLSVDKKATFTTSVVAQRTYDILFWADVDGSYTRNALTAISFVEDQFGTPANMDAFACRKMNQLITVSTPAVTDVVLTRPMAQICINGLATPTSTITSPSVYNLLTDQVTTDKSFTYTTTSFYLFTPAEARMVDMTVGSHNITNVPVARNYKTNINITE